MSGDEATVGSGAARPRPGLAHGWTQGPAAEDASVLARTDWNMAVAVGFGLIAVIVVLAGLVGVRDQRQARAERG